MSEVKNEVKSSVLTKLDLLKAWFKWCLAVEVPVSFDRMQALAFGYSMNKILRKLYKDNHNFYSQHPEEQVFTFLSKCIFYL